MLPLILLAIAVIVVGATMAPALPGWVVIILSVVALLSVVLKWPHF